MAFFSFRRGREDSKYFRLFKNDARVFGFLSERLLDVWLTKNKIRYCELPVLNLEPVNWPQKIAKFLLRKAGLKKLIE